MYQSVSKLFALLLSIGLLGEAHALTIAATYTGVLSGGRVTTTFDGLERRLRGGQMGFATTEALPELGLDTTTITGWCIEPFEYVSRGEADWEIVALQNGPTNPGGMGEVRANYLRELYYHAAPDFTQVVSRSLGLALQMATWEIVRDDALGNFDLYSGNVSFKDAYPSDAIKAAQNLLDLVVNDGIQGPMLDNLYAATIDGHQDMVWQIDTRSPSNPVPAPPTLLLLGLGLLAWLPRRKART